MAAEEIIFKIPEALRAGYDSGAYERIGAIIKDSTNGKIVGHVQETGIGQTILNNATGSLFSPANTLSSVGANIQLAKLNKMVEAMQFLQYASIGIGVAGIGVSIIGFAMMNRKLNAIEQSIGNLSAKIDSHFKALHDRELRRIFAKITYLFQYSDAARTFDNWQNEFVSISTMLGEQSAYLREEIQYLLTQNTYEEGLFSILLRPMLASDAARVELLIETGRWETAYKVAESIGENYSQLFDPLSARQLLKRAQNSQELSLDQLSRHRIQLKMETVANALRDITDKALTRPLLVEYLDSQKINGQAYINRLRDEKEEPLLIAMN